MRLCKTCNYSRATIFIANDGAYCRQHAPQIPFDAIQFAPRAEQAPKQADKARATQMRASRSTWKPKKFTPKGDK